MPNNEIVWEPECYFENGNWRGGWRLSQVAADERDRKYLTGGAEKLEASQGNTEKTRKEKTGLSAK